MTKFFTMFYNLHRTKRYLLKYFLYTILCCCLSSFLWYFWHPIFFRYYLTNLYDSSFLTIKSAVAIIQYTTINIISLIVLAIGFFFRRKQDFYESDHKNMFEEFTKSGTELILAVHELQESEREYKLLIEKSKATEKDAIMKRSLLRNVIDLVPLLVFAKNNEGKFIIANKTVGKIYGVHPKKLIGKTDSDFTDKKDEVYQFLKYDQQVIQNNVKVSYYETITDCNGNVLTLKTWKKPFCDDNGERAVLGVSMIIDKTN